MHLQAIIIDDEPLARAVLEEYLQPFGSITVAARCGDGFEGVKAIMQHEPDLIFLDIQMPKINGFEMLELVEAPPAVIFTTAFDEYAIQAFEANAVDYLLKPYSRERFEKAVQKWLDGRQQQSPAVAGTAAVVQTALQAAGPQNRVVVKNGSRITIIPDTDILYLEAADDYVKIHSTQGVFLKKNTLSHFEKTLDAASFIRTHRSYMVHIQQITRIEPWEKDSFVVILRDGRKIPVSKSGYARVRQALQL
jgi:two-component system, LytTR family, response regulator